MQNLTVFAQYQGLIGLVLLGVSVILTIFDRVARQRQKELIDTQDRLIDAMKTERGHDLERIEALEEQQKQHHETILKFEGANSMLKALLTEKDEASVGYRQRAFAAFDKTDATYAMTAEMVALLKTLCERLEPVTAKKSARRR